MHAKVFLEIVVYLLYTKMCFNDLLKLTFIAFIIAAIYTAHHQLHQVERGVQVDAL